MFESVFGFLKTILDIKRISIEVKTFFLFLRRNKIINLPIVFSSLFLVFLSYELISYLYKDTIYMRSKKRLETIQNIDNVLRSCGDKTAITVSTVSINENEENQSWNGLFEHARACDFVNNPKGCIVNLVDFNDLYKKPQKIDLSTYQFLLRIGGNQTPTYFYLRDDENKQSLESISDYPVAVKILSSTNWYREGILNSLWITSVVNLNKKVIYVLTMISAKPIRENSCINQGYSLSEMKSHLQSYDN